MRSFLRHCRPYFVVAGIFSLFINLLQLTVPLYMLQVYDRVLASRSGETLWMLTLLAVGALLLHGVLEILRSRLLLAAGVALDGIAGPAVLRGIFESAAQPARAVHSASVKDLATLRGFLTGNGLVTLFDAPWLPLYLAVICAVHWGLGLIAAAGAVALLLLAWLNERLTRAPLASMERQAHQAASCIDAGVRNAEVSNALGMLDALQRRWHVLNHQVIDAHVAASRTAALLGGLTRFARLLLQVVMLAAGAWLVIQQQTSAGVMIMGTLVLARALAPVENAVLGWKQLTEARGAHARLAALLDGAAPEPTRIALPVPRGRLTMEQLVFTLPGRRRPVLRGIDLCLEPGESLGVVGPSGGGKSSLARLATGLWQPDAGAVRLDAAELSRWPKAALGPHIGYLPQDVELFGGSVAENIARLGEPDSDAVVTAARRAHAHEMILRLPQGYETQVGDNGRALSGGQRQRIALARALYGNPRLMVLDEPNASLDRDGDAALAEALRELRECGVTVMVVSHRTELLAQMDKLLLLEDGRMQLFGPRANVLARLRQAAAQAAHAGTQAGAGKVLNFGTSSVNA